MSEQFLIHKKLTEDSSRFCATLLIGEGIHSSQQAITTLEIKEDSGNGTMTFVQLNDKIYGITCWHVVEELRRLNLEFGTESAFMFYTMLPKPKFFVDKFERVHSDSIGPLDIGLMEIGQSILDFMGKEALNLNELNDPTELEFGLAVGFPEGLKYFIDEQDERALNQPKSIQVLSLPQCTIVAEIDYVPDGRFNIQSNLEEPHPYETYSGMSGAPVLWCNEEEYGIFGIARAVGTHDGFAERKAISVACELATPSEIVYWISEYERTKKA